MAHYDREMPADTAKASVPLQTNNWTPSPAGVRLAATTSCPAGKAGFEKPQCAVLPLNTQHIITVRVGGQLSCCDRVEAESCTAFLSPDGLVSLLLIPPYHCILLPNFVNTEPSSVLCDRTRRQYWNDPVSARYYNARAR